VPIWLSLSVIVGVLAITAVLSLRAQPDAGEQDELPQESRAREREVV
jgi:hypothetical protein